MRYEQVPADTFHEITFGAGVILSDFSPENGVASRENILCATTGGVTFSVEATDRDFGEDMDNCPANTRQLRRRQSYDATLSGTALTVTPGFARSLTGGADIDSENETHVVPRRELAESDFMDIWLVANYSDKNTGDGAGFMALRLKDALNTLGLQMQTAKDEKGTFDFEFHAHYDLTRLDAVPFAFYVRGGLPDVFRITPPTKTAYEIGDALDLAGLSVFRDDADVTSDCTFAPADGTPLNSPGAVTLSVRYRGAVIETFVILVAAADVTYRMMPPAKTAYNAGETLDLTGVRVFRDDADVTSDCTFAPADGTPLNSPGAVTLSASYGGAVVASLTLTVADDEDEDAEIIASGDEWTLYDNGTLSVYFAGDMPNYYTSSKSRAPWYAYRDKITRAAIGASVTAIGDYAFYACSSMTSVAIPASVASIGEGAFYNCYALTSAAIPDGVTTVRKHTFYQCRALTSVTIPDGVTSIGYYAFYQCRALNNVAIPDSVTEIGGFAFSYCYALTGAAIGDGVKTIGEHAFDGCNALENVTIPDGVTLIDDYAFCYCARFTLVSIPDSVTEIGSHAFAACTKLTSVAIPDGVTAVKQRTFSGCTSLTDVSIPDSVINIGEGAFYNCQKLGRVTIPDHVSDIEENAFYQCVSLTEITIPDHVLTIGANAFQNCSRLGSVTIGDGVTSIGDYAFNNCDELTEITLPDGVKSLGERAFYSAGRLAAVTIGAGLESVGERAFDKCAKLAAFSVAPASAHYAAPGGVLFDSRSATLIRFPPAKEDSAYEIPAGTAAVGDYAFSSCSRLQSVTIPAGTTNIGASAFASCTSLSGVSIPPSVTAIGDYAFGGTVLTSVTVSRDATMAANSFPASCVINYYEQEDGA